MNKKVVSIEHDLVPKHEILTEEEAQAILSEFGITTEQIPKILEHDPVIKSIEAKKGQIIKILRKSHTAGETVYYRIVV